MYRMYLNELVGPVEVHRVRTVTNLTLKELLVIAMARVDRKTNVIRTRSELSIRERFEDDGSSGRYMAANIKSIAKTHAHIGEFLMWRMANAIEMEGVEILLKKEKLLGYITLEGDE